MALRQTTGFVEGLLCLIGPDWDRGGRRRRVERAQARRSPAPGLAQGRSRDRRAEADAQTLETRAFRSPAATWATRPCCLSCSARSLSRAQQGTAGVETPRTRALATRARDFDRQVAEFQVGVAVPNGCTAFGTPATKVMGYVCPGEAEVRPSTDLCNSVMPRPSMRGRTVSQCGIAAKIAMPAASPAPTTRNCKRRARSCRDAAPAE